MGLGRANVSTSLHNSLHRPVDRCDVVKATIGMLPDVALLQIFDFYVCEAYTGEWYTLVHVCRKWRAVVFRSPHLNLQLHVRLKSKPTTPMADLLGLWPQFPIAISVFNEQIWDLDDIFTAFGHSYRISQLRLWRVSSRQLVRILAEMRQPFPALTELKLEPGDEKVVDVPASFLGGSAPSLRELSFYQIRFPELPNLLLSATHLIRLQLTSIPHSGYITSEALVTCLSVLTRLEILHIGLKSPRSRPYQELRRPPPQKRTLLPVLAKFHFRGHEQYLEHLVAWIDSPLLDNLDISFFYQPLFNTPELTQFIRRTSKFNAHDEERVVSSYLDGSLTLPQTAGGTLNLKMLPKFWNDLDARGLL